MGDREMSAPERIWLGPLSGGKVSDFTMWTETQASFAENSPRIEYTRADLSAAREAAARREGWEAAKKQAAALVLGMSRTRTYTDEDLGTMTARNLVKPATVAAAILAMKETDQ
jgi:hypothetical protein